MVLPEDIDIKEGLDDFLRELAKRGDIIVPIARRGVRTLQLAKSFEDLFKNGRVLYYDAIIFHGKEFKNKKIILFDECVNTGNTLDRLGYNLQKFSQKNKLDFEHKIYTASLFVNHDANHYPDYCKFILNREIYKRFNKMLHYQILSKGEPMDVDHMIGKIELLCDQSQFLDTLCNVYSAKETGHSREYGDVVMLTIDFSLPNMQAPFEFNILCMEGLPLLFDEGPRKLRIYIKENIVYLVPIIYPGMEINKNITLQPKSCPLLEKIGNRALCEVLKNGCEKKQHILCYNCIINELCTDLLTQFLVSLSERIDFNFVGLDDICLQVVSHNESIKLIRDIKDKIRKSIENTAYDPSIVGKVAEKCEFKGVSYKNDVSTVQGNYIKLELEYGNDKKKIRLRPEVEISTALNENKEVNNSLFLKRYSSELDIEPEGLSYSQIRDLMKNMDDQSFSDGMDVALDVGYLKPITVFGGMEIYAGGRPYHAIIRVYTTASEDVGKSLKCFLRLITPKG